MKKVLSILLCLTMLAGLLTGCTAAGEPIPYVPVGEGLEGNEGQEKETSEETEEGEFMLAYNPDEALNPLFTTEYTNRVIFSLIYQGLFATSRSGEVIPILCKNYSASSDLTVYEFTLDPMATFSDGVPVTAEDVVASLRESTEHKYFGRRLLSVNYIEATEGGNVRIYLAQPNANLPMLLDIPIVKAEQVEADSPLGTGPYVMKGWQHRSLARNENWWCQSDDLQVNFDKIPLVSANSPAGIRDAFEFFGVDLVCADPGSDLYAEYRCDYEVWDCESGIFVYLGINEDSPVFQNAEIRRAISKGINRDLLADQYYRGFAKSASLPASPGSPFYTAALAKQYAYDPVAYQNAMSSVKGYTVKLLVNSGDSLRVKVAQEIGRMLNTSGLLVEVDARSGGYYDSTLEKGEYDMYLGQTKLSPNMDLSPFFGENGTLNYGDMDDVGIYTMCQQALVNQGDYYTLHQAVMDDGYLCPIVFRSYAVYATRGVFENLQPARDNVFCYSIGRKLTDAYLVQGM